jgi:hypothetical protein
MTCERWDEEIALWAGDDAVSEAFLGHLAGCGRCQREVREMRLARAAWTEWTPRTRQRMSWWWGVAAAVPLLVWAGWPEPVAVEELALRMPTAPAGPGYVPVAGKVMKKRVMRREAAVTMKLLTDDPEVVILLLGEGE